MVIEIGDNLVKFLNKNGAEVVFVIMMILVIIMGGFSLTAWLVFR